MRSLERLVGTARRSPKVGTGSWTGVSERVVVFVQRGMEERVVELVVVVLVPTGLERVVGTGRRKELSSRRRSKSAGTGRRNGSWERVVGKSCRRRSKAGMGRRGHSNSVVDVGT